MIPMLAWFRALMPKEDRFFDLFEQHAAIVFSGAESLRAALNEESERKMNLQRVSQREGEADLVTREVLLAVRRSFITPFDRSAITRWAKADLAAARYYSDVAPGRCEGWRMKTFGAKR